MNCPACATEMDEHARHGVKVDHCPACGGVWLDRGELDSLIAAVRPPVTLPDPEPSRPAAPPPPQPDVLRGKRYTRQKAQRPVQSDARHQTSRKPGKAQRYTRRYSNTHLLKDLLEDIFDFD